eukprot:COSAG04_NODE_42_length_32379_cov_41.656691_18_plen_831_part_00
MPGSTTEDEEEETAPMTGAAAAPAEEGVPVAAEQVELALDDAEPPPAEQPKKKRDKLAAAGGLLRTASAAVARATGSAEAMLVGTGSAAPDAAVALGATKGRLKKEEKGNEGAQNQQEQQQAAAGAAKGPLKKKEGGNEGAQNQQQDEEESDADSDDEDEDDWDLGRELERLRFVLRSELEPGLPSSHLEEMMDRYYGGAWKLRPPKKAALTVLFNEADTDVSFTIDHGEMETFLNREDIGRTDLTAGGDDAMRRLFARVESEQGVQLETDYDTGEKVLDEDQFVEFCLGVGIRSPNERKHTEAVEDALEDTTATLKGLAPDGTHDDEIAALLAEFEAACIALSLEAWGDIERRAAKQRVAQRREIRAAIRERRGIKSLPAEDVVDQDIDRVFAELQRWAAFEPFELCVREFPTGNEHQIEVRSVGMTLGHLKAQLQAATGMEIDHQRLVIAKEGGHGTPLPEDEELLLQDCGVEKGVELQLSVQDIAAAATRRKQREEKRAAKRAAEEESYRKRLDEVEQAYHKILHPSVWPGIFFNLLRRGAGAGFGYLFVKMVDDIQPQADSCVMAYTSSNETSDLIDPTNSTWDGCAYWRPIREGCAPPTCVANLIRYCVSTDDLDDANESWDDLLFLTKMVGTLKIISAGVVWLSTSKELLVAKRRAAAEPGLVLKVSMGCLGCGCGVAILATWIYEVGARNQLPSHQCANAPLTPCCRLGQIIWLVAWVSVPRVGYESREMAEVEICGANPDFERLSDLIAKWLWYWLSQLVAYLFIQQCLCKKQFKAWEQAKALGPVEQFKARERTKPLRVVLRLFVAGAAAWVAYEIVKANE